MNAQLAPEDRDIEPAPEGARALLRSVVITDLCDSTALVDRLGDVRATELIRAHDRLLRGLIREHRGQEIDKTDGFLSLFERPIQAVAFALAYQRGLRAFSLEHGVEVSARIGLHVGEVMTWQNDEADVAKGAKPTEVEGLAKPVAARLMGMALPGQILLSGVAYTLAHRAEGELGAALSRVQWKAHGDFRFKGVAEAVPVYEIGEEGVAPFKAPAWSGKAHREVPLWRRPAMLAFELMVLVVAVALPAWHFLKPEPAIAFAERDWVVLGDLRNLSSDLRFNESLEQALRIGLEQSPHVNLVPALRERETLALMQIDPDTTVVDRSVGTQLALREGAKALILPTVAEVGGRLRVTLEVVEPGSQTTVMSLAADGSGAESVLASIDRVSAELRERLGESLAQIEQSSTPLPRAATPDLDALRAFALARNAIAQNRLKDALALAQQALEIDPQFAAAYLTSGAIQRNTGNREAAVAAFRAALALPDRLSTRERLTAEALLSEFEGSPVDTIARWKAFSEVYPDDIRALSALGHYQWTGAYDLAGAAATLQRVLEGRGAGDGVAHYTLGAVLLGMDRPTEALAQFSAYEQSGRQFENQFFATAHASQRDFAAANAALDRGVQSGLGLRSATTELMRAVFLIDAGNIEAGRARLTRAAAQMRETSTRFARVAPVWELSVESVLGARDEMAARLGATSRHGLLDTRTDALLNERVEVRRVRHVLAWLAARAGEPALAREIVGAEDERGLLDAHPLLRQHAAISAAAILCAEGKVEAGLSGLQAELDQLDGLYSLRVAAIDCVRRSGDWAGVEMHARWLAEHRGRAYAEMHGDYGLIAFNVAYSTLALLDLSEALREQGRDTEADTALQEFVQRWPIAGLPELLAGRVRALKPEA